MTTNTKAAVIIPFYKTILTRYEEIALKQCFNILDGHPIIAVKPHSLTLPESATKKGFYDIISFDDKYFADIHGYNALMLSEEFYKSFINYEYILIYQLDAFVFRDELIEWCSKGYDYIGAPWTYKKAPGLVRKLKNYLYFKNNAKYKDGMPKIGRQMEDRVGNGGFSLRRVKTFANYAASQREKIEEYLRMRHPWFNEDIFWSIELNRKKQQLVIPELKTALKFAFETNLDRCLHINNNQLPFGCHAWDKHADFWRPIFKSFNADI
ncbi:hypothetical protein EOD41_07545 [Mucilaginibacter limnophilus]|uniref:DUF5672 domain-containing protein n=1 Tax=Mucilaginibacter limnophilus TaxID=1932778 RepID=A0A3S2V9A5_9SPHI|nr:DUF5672 family protein [Mucilaginibacter limnophilus]RVU01803.1 hypothetical protein EOD41_07545 [Mucilaginibacter limnophilus]